MVHLKLFQIVTNLQKCFLIYTLKKIHVYMDLHSSNLCCSKVNFSLYLQAYLKLLTMYVFICKAVL